mgnify:CR=1 FL=1
MSKYQEDEQFEKAIAIDNDKDKGVKTHKTPIYQRNDKKHITLPIVKRY